MFLTELKTNAQSLQIQEDEVDAVRLFSFDEINVCMQQKHSEYAPDSTLHCLISIPSLSSSEHY